MQKKKVDSFGAAFRLYCGGMDAAKRAETMKCIDDQRQHATKTQARILDSLQTSLLEVWNENPPTI